MVSASASALVTPPAVSAPTRLRLPDLLNATDRCADDVLSGRYDRLLPAGGPPVDERWYSRLYGDDELDIWLISWVPDRSTELHDHGGSLGALTVVSGALTETRWNGEAFKRRRLRAGDQAAFPLGWVHDVVWAPAAAGSRVTTGGSVSAGRSAATGGSVSAGRSAATGGLVSAGRSAATGGSVGVSSAPVTLSVHAYSPPLTAMSYYEVTDRQTLRRNRTELTDAPEG